jgi:hypothetical protein
MTPGLLGFTSQSTKFSPSQVPKMLFSHVNPRLGLTFSHTEWLFNQHRQIKDPSVPRSSDRASRLTWKESLADTSYNNICN